jgi:hypothetical protein
MATKTRTRLSARTFTAGERRKLHALRRQYEQGVDLLSGQERARLLFIRWLRETDRLSA